MPYIMIVDDDEDFLQAAAVALRSAGHEVATETEPERVVDTIRQRRPDLLILDVMFPEDLSEGFSLAREIRDLQGMSEVPVVMLTAVNQRFPMGFGSQDIDGAWMPVSDFVEKPVDMDVLTSRVNELVAK